MLRAALLGGGGGGAVAPLAAQLAASVAVPLLRRAFTAGSLPRRSLAAVENLFREMEGRQAGRPELARLKALSIAEPCKAALAGCHNPPAFPASPPQEGAALGERGDCRGGCQSAGWVLQQGLPPWGHHPAALAPACRPRSCLPLLHRGA